LHADIGQFILLAHAGGIEVAAPGFIDPSADPDPDPSRHEDPPCAILIARNDQSQREKPLAIIANNS
jgi:hypothetical protein